MPKKSKLKNIQFLAGKRAIDIIRDEGLRADRIKVMAGAAGGPKWLVLYGIDRVLFPLFKKRKEPLFTLGSSIGAWRMFALALGEKSHERFKDAYIEQRYTERPAPREITDVSRKILEFMVEGQSLDKVLSHPFFHLNLFAVRSRNLFKSENSFAQHLGFTGTAFVNIINRKGLRYFFERTLFYDKRVKAPFFNIKDFPIQKVHLSEKNILDAVLASGSIPLVMAGINNISGAKRGVYRDGGMIDYHLDIEYLDNNDDNLVFYPHYAEQFIPGWLDKKLSYRKPVSHSRDNIIMVCPANEFIESLPMGKIPDRDDFMLFAGKDRERIEYWNRVIARSQELAEDFVESIESGSIKEQVRPLPW